MHLLARSSEPVVEGTIGRLHLQTVIENYQRVDHRIQDRFCIFPLINSLPETGAEGGEIRERKYRAAYPVIGRGVGSDTNEKISVASFDLMAGWHSIDHCLYAHPVNFRKTQQRLNVARASTNIRRADAQRLRRRPIETSYLALKLDNDDGDIDRV